MPVNVFEAGDRNQAGFDQVVQHISGADRRKLVGVSHKQEMGAVGDRPEEGGCQAGIEHAGLVHDDEVRGERVVFICSKAALCGIIPEQPVNGLSVAAGGFGQSFGCAAGWGCEQHLAAFGLEDGDNSLEECGFAGSRTPGDDRDLG
ncbi:MAG: hypothetical protein BWY82_02497 [Verrucomicrobia bacterium ADurb.Bin474]|nr:MAG: hypothetical protein BWY82_02497 [Verrucomicrobia bacterium ADurb.Bin474]